MADDSKKTAVKVGVAVVALILAGVVLAVTMRGGTAEPLQSDQQYFLDLGTDTLYAVPAGVEPPQTPPSNHQEAEGRPGGVRAYVFTCGACTESEMFVGYIETYTPQTAKAMAELKAKYPDVALEDLPTGELQAFSNVAGGKLWASRDLSTGWLPSNTPQAVQLRTEAITKCGGTPVKPCMPTNK
jgi:hypothetical protein